MTSEIVERVLRSSRYRDVEPSLLARLAEEELPHSRNAEDAVKRVKRRLHQAVGAFRSAPPHDMLGAILAAWHGDLADPAFRGACVDALRAHASTRERITALERFYPQIWQSTGTPRRFLDVGCGLNPLALPWMQLPVDTTYVATDVDQRALAIVEAFLAQVGQPHEVRAADAISTPPTDATDVALLLKLIPTLDRQDREASVRLLRALRARHAVVSFPARSLGGRGKGMERTYRSRLEELAEESGRVREVAEASVPNELVFVLTLEPMHG